jgi:hypothetical protein
VLKSNFQNEQSWEKRLLSLWKWKKYKKCHLGKELPNHAFNMESKKNKVQRKVLEKVTFQDLLQGYQTFQTILAIGMLQVYPPNHGRNIHLEEMARDCLRVMQKNKSLQAPAWSELQEAISGCGAGMHIETPWNTFTGNVIFKNGNNIVYPGIYNQGSRILNEIIIALLLLENKLPEQFRSSVLSGIALLLSISDLVAGSLKHSRYMNIWNESGMIEFPSYKEGLHMIDALTFTQEQIGKICEQLDAVSPEVINYFLIDLGSPELLNDDPDENIVVKKPFLKIDSTIYLYMPTAITSSLIDFAFKQAEQFECKEEFLRVIQKAQKDIMLQALDRMHWKRISIPLPPDPLNLTNTELLYQFDNQKVAYVCFLNMGFVLSQEAQKVDDPLATRNKQVLEHLLAKDASIEVLTLYVFPDIGSEILWSWGKPLQGNYSLMFRIHELELIANRNDVDSLSLWKFSKALYRAGEKVKFACQGMIELYGYYEDNEGSLLHTDEENKGIFHIDGRYAAQMFIEHEVNEDRHAIMTRMSGQLGFLHVHRYREYAPIYKPDVIADFILIVKSFTTPIWIRSNQTTQKGIRNWGHDVAEAIAFWLTRLSDTLADYLNKFRYLQFNIEVNIADQLLKGGDFIIPEKLPDDVELLIDVNANAIMISIPFAFALFAWRNDNVADKILIKTTIEGIIQCSTLRGNKIEISNEELDRIINKTLAPDRAKMLLFNNTHHDPRLDIRNLTSFHTIHKADTAQVFDDLLSYLPSGYIIPYIIKTRGQKLELVDDIISALLQEIKTRLSKFDGIKFIQCLIHLNEACTQKKEFLEILRPPRIACFSSFDEEVKKILDESQDLVSTGHALRTLIEFTGTNFPKGSMKPGCDNIGELMAFVDQLMSIGYLREVLENNLAEPEMDKLPSGRLGINKDIYRKVFEPLHRARAQGKVLAELEKFEIKYTESQGTIGSTKGNNAELNDAFNDEFGFSFDHLYAVIHVLTEEGFEKGQSVVIRKELYLIEKFVALIIGMDKERARHILDFLTLPIRTDIVFSKNEKNEYEKQFVPWRNNRPFSYLMKPLVKNKDKDGNDCFYYGYRQLTVSIHHYLYLIYNAKLPSPRSKKMKSFLGGIASNLGKPFEIEFRDWLKKNSSLEIQPEEVYPSKLSNKSVDEKLGDIDVLAADHVNKIIYSIECKNTRGARNVIEMVGEMNTFLGIEDTGEKSKIQKHFERDQWLKGNLKFLESIVSNAEEYSVKSIVLTADELSIEYLGGSKLLLPVVSFSKLKLEGIKVLENV